MSLSILLFRFCILKGVPALIDPRGFVLQILLFLFLYTSLYPSKTIVFVFIIVSSTFLINSFVVTGCKSKSFQGLFFLFVFVTLLQDIRLNNFLNFSYSLAFSEINDFQSKPFSRLHDILFHGYSLGSRESKKIRNLNDALHFF